MKKLILLIVFSVMINLTTVLYAQQNTFSKVIKDIPEFAIQAYSVVTAFDNTYLIAGTSHSQNGLIINIDSEANVLWNKVFSNVNQYNSIFFNKIISSNDSCFVIVGKFHNSTSSHDEALCIKINSDGDTLWSKIISHEDYSINAFSIEQTFDLGYILVGYASQTITPKSKVFIAKLDLSGNLEWNKFFEGGNHATKAYSVKQTTDSSYVITGYYENYPPWDPNALLLKLSRTGEYLWAKKYHLSSNKICSGKDIVITNDGFLFYLELYNHLGFMKTDFSGNILWNKSYNLYCWEEYNIPQFHRTYDSCYVFVSGGDFSSCSFTKLDSDGNLIWTKELELRATDVFETINKEFFIIGNGPLYGVKEQKFGQPQIGIIQTDSLGNEEGCVYSSYAQSITDTIISSSATFTFMSGGVENSFYPILNSIDISVRSGCVDFWGSISETTSEKEIIVFPNPSNGVFTFNIDNEKSVQIVVYNTFGEIVFQSELNNQKSEIDLSSKARGIYLYKLLFSYNKIATGKLIFVD